MQLGAVAWELLGGYTANGGYMWSKHKTCKLGGYVSNTKYSTLGKAMAACIGKTACNGVTQEGNGNFRTNKGATATKAAGKTCYIKGSVYTIASGKHLQN